MLKIHVIIMVRGDAQQSVCTFKRTSQFCKTCLHSSEKVFKKGNFILITSKTYCFNDRIIHSFYQDIQFFIFSYSNALHFEIFSFAVAGKIVQYLQIVRFLSDTAILSSLEHLLKRFIFPFVLKVFSKHFLYPFL